jgi:2-phosphoglycolate phosphatase
MSKPPKALQAVIFDLDGTLVDTAAEFVVIVQALRREHGREEMDPDTIRASVSNGALALASLALDLDPQSTEAEQKRLRLLELYHGVLGSVAQPYPGIPELLQRLADKQIAWGISTNKPRAFTAPLLRKLDLQPEAGSVVCPDDVTHRKPHPEPLLLNCRQLDCSPPRTIYVGDHIRDIEAGRRAGMYTIAATYGYIEAHDEPESWGADASASCSTGLAAIIFDD